MRLSVLGLICGASLCSAFVVVSCGSDGGGGSSGGTSPDASGAETGGGPDGGTDGPIGPADAAKKDGDTDLDGAIADDGGMLDGGGPAEVQLIGRFAASDGTGRKFAYPGSRLVARFNGTDAVVTLSQTDGFSGGPSWFNVVVDGVLQPAPFSVTGASADYAVAQGLPAGAHTIVVEKRTEPNLGVVRYEGFKFAAGGKLISAPPRPARRMEFLSDSTIDGFGVEGDRNPGGANYCGAGGLAPAQFNNARKSMSAIAAASLSAEYFLIAYSGKGLTVNGSAGDTLYFPQLYDRTLPDDPASAWSFASWVPDAVVLSLGGVDFDNLAAEPPGFSAAYGVLVDKIRAAYPQAYVFMTVWSQIKDDFIATRTAMKSSLQGIIDARGDPKMKVFLFPTADVNADETGCQFHGNAAHHVNMAASLVTFIKATIPGW